MAISMTEQLKRIYELRQAAAAQQEAFDKQEEGARAPAIKPASFDMMEKIVLNLHGIYDKGKVGVTESIMSTDAIKIIPKIIEGQLREAQEPVCIASKFMNVIHVDGGNTAVYVVPVVGELHASEVSEGGRYNEDSVEFNTIENGSLEVRVKKIGLKVSISEEAISESSWDIYGINVRKMGQAMGRYKEEWCFNSFTNHGHVIFDNNRRDVIPEAGTTGRAADGSFNDTLSVEDFLDMAMALMGNGMTPTDVIAHPLIWTVFAANGMIGNGMTFGALGGMNVHPWGATQGTPGFAGLSADMGPQQFYLKPSDVQNRLPLGMNILLSNFVPFDKVNKKMDMYCIDRNNVGVIVEREGLSTENWTDPERDIRLLKVKERYGVGILENGRGITVARNIAVAPTYPVPPTVKIQQEA